ncbi:hypothetical protein V6N13_125012 [Hibiscus sabdariffa]|uniref:Uncharacterized protein n=1 Tax=Hibiscus sabdariffa TaxID=183260 RepID=A0ABR2U4I9_9ROSI
MTQVSVLPFEYRNRYRSNLNIVKSNPPNPPPQNVEPELPNAQAECYRNMADMFKQFMTSMRADQVVQLIVVVVQYAQAFIDMLSQQ